jgi:murein DD-endopeptidase MepM/ murein hydrolase activator NlpD
MLNARSIRFYICHAALCLAMMAMAVQVSAAPVEKVYTVRRGDTLYGIARNNQVSPGQLAERNGLSRNYYVYTGQRLVIPNRSSSKDSSLKETSVPELPSSLKAAIDQADVKPGRWKHIVIHHSGVDTGTVKGMDRFHRDVRHMKNGLAYHFVIGNGSGMNDGEIAVGTRWTKQLDGGHLASASQNKISLGICLVGNFEKHKPTVRQLDALRTLVRALMARYQLSLRAVTTHRQIHARHTRCPGRHFPTKQFLDSLKASGSKGSPTKR